MITKIEGNYLYFCVKDNPEFMFRKPIEAYETQQLKDANEVLVEIVDYSSSLKPYFTIIGYVKNGEIVKMKDFEEASSSLRCGTMITCTITRISRAVMASFDGFECMMPNGSFTDDFREKLKEGDSVKARVYLIDKEKKIIQIFPILSSYADPIKNREINQFFFTVEEKIAPNELLLTFDNGETAYFSIYNSFIWLSLLEGELYCDFQRDLYDENKLSYKKWREDTFKKIHPIGDMVKAHISHIGKICIAWSEGAVGKIVNYKGKNIEIGKDYNVMVVYNEKEQVEFKMI